MRDEKHNTENYINKTVLKLAAVVGKDLHLSSKESLADTDLNLTFTLRLWYYINVLKIESFQSFVCKG